MIPFPPGFFGLFHDGQQFGIIFFLEAFIQLDILPGQAVGEAGGYAYFIDGEPFQVQQDDLGEVLDVAFDGGLGMVGALLDLGELVATEVKFQDLGLVPQGSFGWVVPRPISCRQALAVAYGRGPGWVW